MRRLLLGLLTVAITFGLVACSGDDDDGPTTTASASSASSSTPATSASTTSAATTSTTVSDSVTTTTVACPGLEGASTARRTSSVPESGGLLTSVTARGGCADTVTFTFRATNQQPPGYAVQYQPKPIRADASDNVVPVKGSAVLVVRLEPAYGFDFENNQTTLTTPKRFTPTGTNHVREVVQTGDFEAVVSYAIGLDAKRPFQVVTTGDVANPTLRVVIG